MRKLYIFMNITLFLYVFALFVVLQPNVLIKTKKPRILLHGLVFTIILYFTYDLVKNLIEGNETYTITLEEPGNLLHYLHAFMRRPSHEEVDLTHTNEDEEHREENEENENNENYNQKYVGQSMHTGKLKHVDSNSSDVHQDDSEPKKYDVPALTPEPSKEPAFKKRAISNVVTPAPETSSNDPFSDIHNFLSSHPKIGEKFDSYKVINDKGESRRYIKGLTLSKVPENSLDVLVNTEDEHKWIAYQNDRWEMGNNEKVFWYLNGPKRDYPPTGTWTALTKHTKPERKGEVIFK